MKIFQFYFNTKKKEGLIFDIFLFDPKTDTEKKLGNLYMIGSLKNALPKNYDFLTTIATKIRESFYKSGNLNPEHALKASLKETNEFLRKIVKEGDVSWLGNLSFAVVNLKEFKLNFTKVGKIKMYLLRGKKLVDIYGKIKVKDIEHYPLTFFGNVVAGSLIENDLLFVLTEKVAHFFQKEEIFEKLKELNYFTEKEFQKILQEKKENLSEIEGVALIIFASEKELFESKKVVEQKGLKEFSLKEAITMVLRERNKNLKIFTLKEIFLPFKEFFILIFKRPQFLLILIFVILLLLGYFVFNYE